MKKLIIITGDLASGKSTFSHILAERFGIEVYNKDTIKEVLGDTIGFTNREENLKLSHATVGLMIHIFRTYAQCGHDVILEANFHTGEMNKLMEIAGEFGYRVLTVNLYADEHVLFERFRNRIENENRHPVHKSVGLDTFEDFCRYIETSRREVIPGERIDVDAMDFGYQKDEELIDRIGRAAKSKKYCDL